MLVERNVNTGRRECVPRSYFRIDRRDVATPLGDVLIEDDGKDPAAQAGHVERGNDGLIDGTATGNQSLLNRE